MVNDCSTIVIWECNSMKNRGYKILFEYIEITLGCALVAVGLVLFLVPNTIAPGGE